MRILLVEVTRFMPTYVYGCDACGHQFEQFQKFSDEPIRVCPRCDAHVRRIFQPAGIVFKGSGWHITDYKRNGSNNGKSASGDAETAKDSTAPADATAKSEPAKSDTKSTGSDPAPAASAS
jgi:putative FmdB family regulatory protein